MFISKAKNEYHWQWHGHKIDEEEMNEITYIDIACLLYCIGYTIYICYFMC